MDGIKLMIESSGDDEELNCCNNWWTCDHYVNADFIFCPNRTIPICCYNVLGTVHDSMGEIVRKIYVKFEDIFNS